MVHDLCGVCYDSCIDDTHNIGMIAQDVEKVEPRLVGINEAPSTEDIEKYNIEDNKIYGLNYSGLGPILIEAVKEQQKQIECLKQEIEILKGN
jgi:hypothetical protein